MAAFAALDLGRLDVFALLVGDGIATLEPSSAERSLDWLRAQAYKIQSINFAHGIGPVVAWFGAEFRWKQQFGYELEAEDRNLARLRDGFWYDVQPEEGLVLELRSFERAFQEDRDWSAGLLRIISRHSRYQLALGHRTFAIVHVTDGDSPVVGVTLGERSVLYPYSFPQAVPLGSA
ncbi:MAG: hypothetical protein U5L74_13020 [Ideonella sp.]|nr:hypothetical protein [Ideonella sp.]